MINDCTPYEYRKIIQYLRFIAYKKNWKYSNASDVYKKVCYHYGCGIHGILYAMYNACL